MSKALPIRAYAGWRKPLNLFRHDASGNSGDVQMCWQQADDPSRFAHLCIPSDVSSSIALVEKILI